MNCTNGNCIELISAAEPLLYFKCKMLYTVQCVLSVSKTSLRAIQLVASVTVQQSNTKRCSTCY